MQLIVSMLCVRVCATTSQQDLRASVASVEVYKRRIDELHKAVTDGAEAVAKAHR